MPQHTIQLKQTIQSRAVTFHSGKLDCKLAADRKVPASEPAVGNHWWIHRLSHFSSKTTGVNELTGELDGPYYSQFLNIVSAHFDLIGGYLQNFTI